MTICCTVLCDEELAIRVYAHLRVWKIQMKSLSIRPHLIRGPWGECNQRVSGANGLTCNRRMFPAAREGRCRPTRLLHGVTC